MKKFLSLVLALTMALSLVTVSAGATDFDDDGDITYQEAVSVIAGLGIVDGYSDGTFGPDEALTRGAAAKIICNLILGPTTAAELHADTAPFSDVSINNEFAGYIAYCAKEGIISGYADGAFRPANPLTGYAFMKMLLGALGYDANYEQYVGNNWSINVAKQAIGIGLNKGLVEEFNGVDYVTREEAALYAFNTLKATMVDYENKITANVNGAEVTISNTSAKPVTWSEGINEDGNIKLDGFVQFAEEYFPKLVRNDDSDDFMRPANNWVYDKIDIGTYARYDLLVESYTTEVTGKDVYDLLKSGVINDNDLESYVDGKANTIKESDLVRSNNDKLANTGDGVVTEVYLDTDKELITIVSINTYLAQATADYNESKEYAPLNVYLSDANGRNYNVDVEQVENVVDVKEDTYYQVNVSYKDNATIGEVKVINPVEILEDSTVTKFSSSNSGLGTGRVTKLTTGGEEYKRNVKAFYDDDILDEYDAALLTDATYNVYLDSNGYFLGVDLFEGTKNYVFITGYDLSGSHIAVKTADAAGIFLDGTMQNIKVNIKETNENIADATGHNEAYFQAWGDPGENELNQWYTYTVDANGNYTLKPVVRMTWTKYATGDDQVIRTDNLSIKDNQGNGDRVYGEDATIFITVDTDDVSQGTSLRGITEVTGVYTGVQEVEVEIDTSSADALRMGQIFTVYDSDYYVVGAVVLGEAIGADDNLAYILSGAKSEEKIDDTYYWEFDAVMGGQIQTFTARSKYQSTIQALRPGTVQELRFDGDYVTTIKSLDADELYQNNTRPIKDESVYQMTSLTANVNTLNLQGRTLYITANRDDVGLALAADAKAVVIQDENSKLDVKTEFSSVGAAIAHLADPDNNTSNGTQYAGNIYAVLDTNGVAQWVVFDSSTPLNTGSQSGSGSGSGAQYSYNAWTDVFGQVHATVNYVRPAYVPATDNVTVSFDIYADGQYVGRQNTVSMGAGVDQFVYPAGGFGSGVVVQSGAKIELRNVTFMPTEVYTKFVDASGAAVTVDTGSTPTVSTSTAEQVWFGLSAYTTGGTYVVNGTTTTPAPTGTALNAGGQKTAAVKAAGNDFVTVVFSGLTAAPVTHTVTGLTTATRFNAINSTITTDGTNTLTVTATPNANVADGATVTFTATVASGATFNGAQAYRVVVEKAGISGIVYAGHLSLTGTKAVTDDVTITAADVKITPVAFTKLIGVTWTKDSVTLSFDGVVNVAANALQEASFADTNATLVDKVVSSVTSVTYSVTGGFLAAGDTLNLYLSNLTHDTYGGAVVSTPANATTITLVAGGTVTLS